MHPSPWQGEYLRRYSPSGCWATCSLMRFPYSLGWLFHQTSAVSRRCRWLTVCASVSRRSPFYKSVGMLKNITTWHELANQVRSLS